MLIRQGVANQAFGFPLAGSQPQPLQPADNSSPSWVPAGAAIFADFVNGQYYYSAVGVVSDPSDLFQSDPDDGDPWVPSQIIPGQGYVTPEDSSEIALSFVASPSILLVGATFVFEFDDANAASMHLIAYDAPNFTTFWQAIMAPGTGNSQVSVTDTVTDTGFAPPSGAAKMAVSFAPDRMSASFAGRTAITTTNVSNFNIINRVTGAFSAGPGMAIKTVTAYPLKADAELPALSV